jgi:hypothetical protein
MGPYSHFTILSVWSFARVYLSHGAFAFRAINGARFFNIALPVTLAITLLAESLPVGPIGKLTVCYLAGL